MLYVHYFTKCNRNTETSLKIGNGEILINIVE